LMALCQERFEVLGLKAVTGHIEEAFAHQRGLSRHFQSH
jgi:hypothetical protein